MVKGVWKFGNDERDQNQVAAHASTLTNITQDFETTQVK